MNKQGISGNHNQQVNGDIHHHVYQQNPAPNISASQANELLTLVINIALTAPDQHELAQEKIVWSQFHDYIDSPVPSTSSVARYKLIPADKYYRAKSYLLSLYNEMLKIHVASMQETQNQHINKLDGYKKRIDELEHKVEKQALATESGPSLYDPLPHTFNNDCMTDIKVWNAVSGSTDYATVMHDGDVGNAAYTTINIEAGRGCDIKFSIDQSEPFKLDITAHGGGERDTLAILFEQISKELQKPVHALGGRYNLNAYPEVEDEDIAHWEELNGQHDWGEVAVESSEPEAVNLSSIESVKKAMDSLRAKKK